MDEDDPLSTHSLYSGFLDGLDHNLRLAWRVLRGFCLRINDAVLRQRQLPRELLVDTISSVMYSLLRLRFSSGSPNEVIRLGLLAFGSGVFLQWIPGLPMVPTIFPAILRESLVKFRHADDLPHLMLWVLMIGARNVFSEEDKVWLHPWLRATMDLCGVGSWEDVSAILHTFLWVDVVHENPGRSIFSEVYTAYCSEYVPC
jgi:hypothetical protein